MAFNMRKAHLSPEHIVAGDRDKDHRRCVPPPRCRERSYGAIAEGKAGIRADEADREPQNILREFTAPPFEAGDVPEAIGEYALLFARSAGFCPTATIVAAVVATASMIDDNIRLGCRARAVGSRAPGCGACWWLAQLLARRQQRAQWSSR